MRLIDADALMEIYADKLEAIVECFGLNSHAAGALSGAMKLLETQPTIEPRKKGKWIPQDHNDRNGLIATCVYYSPVCSECGGTGDFGDKFCKHCGTQMEG